MTEMCKHRPWGEAHPLPCLDECVETYPYCSEECQACDQAPDDTCIDDLCMDCYVGCK